MTLRWQDPRVRLLVLPVPGWTLLVNPDPQRGLCSLWGTSLPSPPGGPTQGHMGVLCALIAERLGLPTGRGPRKLDWSVLLCPTDRQVSRGQAGPGWDHRPEPAWLLLEAPCTFPDRAQWSCPRTVGVKQRQ